MSELISKRMTMLRLGKGMTQSQLGKEIGFARSHIANFESGGYAPNERAVQDYCQFFKVPSNYFKEHLFCTEVEDSLQRLFNHLLHEESVAANDELSSMPPFILNLEQEHSFYLLKAALHYGKRELEKAKQIEEDYLIVFQEDDVDSMTTFSQKCYYLYEAEKNYFFGNYRNAISNWKILSNLENCIVKLIRVSLRIIVCYFRSQNYVTVYSLAKEAVGQLEEMELPLLLAKAYALLSASYNQLNLFQESLIVLNKMEALINKYNLTNEKHILYGNRGYIYNKCGRLSDALGNYQKALEIATTIERSISAIISNIHCLIALRQYNIAEEYLKEMRSFGLNEREKMIALSYEAELLLYQGEEKKSWKMQKIALDFFIENGCTHNLSYIYSQLAQHYLEKNMFKKAAFYLEKKEETIHEKNKILLARA